MNKVYRSILKDAFRIAWRNPWLLFFGLFAAVLGSGGEFNILINNLTSVQNQGAYLTDLNSVFTQGSIGAWVATLGEVISNLNVVSVTVLLLILILSLFLLWLAIVAQGGLVSGIWRTYRQQPTSFKQGWTLGVARFWSVLGLNISGKVTTYVLLVILGLPFFWLYVATQQLVWQWVLLVISFFIFVPVAIIISFLIKFAVIFAVVQRSNFRAALLQAWQLFKKNWIVSIELAIILFIINILAGFVIILGLLLLAVPFILVGFVFHTLGIAPLLWLVVVVGSIALLLGLFALGAFLSIFQTGSWVILYARLTDGVVIPKVLRLAAALMSPKHDKT